MIVKATVKEELPHTMGKVYELKLVERKSFFSKKYAESCRRVLLSVGSGYKGQNEYTWCDTGEPTSLSLVINAIEAWRIQKGYI